MNKKLIALLACIPISLSSFAQETKEPVLDTKFIALKLWSEDIDNKLAIWNEHCQDKATTDNECIQFANVLRALQTYYIAAAKQYTKTGDDAVASLNLRAIQHSVRLYDYNLKCVGKNKTKSEFLACHQLSEDVEAEGDRIKEDRSKLDDSF